MKGGGVFILGGLLGAGGVHGMDPVAKAVPADKLGVISSYVFMLNEGKGEQTLTCPPCLENGTGYFFVDPAPGGKPMENPVSIPCGNGPAYCLLPGIPIAMCLGASTAQGRVERYLTVSGDGKPIAILHLRMDPITRRLTCRRMAHFASKKRWALVRVRGF